LFNVQVTESIPKRLFDQANMLKKTLYQRSVQVPKIGTKQVRIPYLQQYRTLVPTVLALLNLN